MITEENKEIYERPLPRRDLWLLPSISLLTALFLLVIAEAGSRISNPQQLTNACKASDPAMQDRYLPNCTAVTKVAEGPWVTNSYNECGYRSPQPCGPVPSNTRRIAVIGTSLGEGYMVPYEQTAGALLAGNLTTNCQAPVEVQNLANIGQGGERLVSNMDAALKLRPQAVLLLVGPHDMETPAGEENVGQNAAPVIQTSLQHRIWTLGKNSRAVIMLQSLLFRNASLYTSIYLMYQDQADFLRVPLSRAWVERLSWFDKIMTSLAEKAQAAHVPLVLVYVPLEAQAALLRQPDLPSNIDPFQLDNNIRQLATRHGIIYHDATEEFRPLSDPMKLFYHVDTHVTGDGYPMIAAALAKQFIDLIPAFGDCNHPNNSTTTAQR